ncbi:sirohydrochlorin ferrochelatase [Bradyrhizobium sp. USDA 4369]
MERAIKFPLADTALLLAAHGERREGADNLGVWRIAQALSTLGFCAEIGVGFISGKPGINAALRQLRARRVAVYPIFMSSGYFSRDRLVQLLDEADDDRQREIISLPPLGLDPGLPAFVTQCVLRIAERSGFCARQSAVILLAHGSRRRSQSRAATERIAKEVERSSLFAGVFSAFLEERPHLDEVAKQVSGPVVVIGLFSGEGLHGARDAPKLVAESARDDVVFGGVLGCAPGIEQLIAGAVTNACSARISAIPDRPL